MIFCMKINTKLSYKLIPLILVGMARPAQINQNNIVMGMARHAQITQLNLHYLCDILRKKSVMELGTQLHWLVQILLL